MQIVCASDIAPSSPRAHAINVVKTAGGLARLGHRVTLVVAEDTAPVDEALASLGERGQGEAGLSVAIFSPRGRLSHDQRARAFGDRAVRIALECGADLLYARHFRAALQGTAAGLATVLETHAYIGDPNRLLDEAFEATRSHGLTIVTISHRLAAHYASRGADPSRLAVVPDGVDLELFARPCDPGPSPLPADLPGPIALHAGHLYEHKGIGSMLDAASAVGDVSLALLGGTDEDIAAVRARAGPHANVRVLGRVAHAAVPAYLWHADVLMLVPSGLEASKDWTSPVKLGEYLASGTPIVASSIPALGDWLGDEVHWCAPDDGADLARAIRAALDEPPDRRAARRVASAALARSLSYPNRAEAIVRAAGVGDASVAGPG